MCNDKIELDNNAIFEMLCNIYENSTVKIIITDNNLEPLWHNKAINDDYKILNNVFDLKSALISLKTDELTLLLKNNKSIRVSHSIYNVTDQNYNLDLTPVICKNKMCYCIVMIIDVYVSDVFSDKDIKFFAENLSVAFRKPLTTVFSALGPLLRKFEDNEDYAGQEYIKTISQNCYHMLKDAINVTDIIKYHNDDKELDLSCTSLNEFLQNLCKSAEYLIRPTGIKIYYTQADEEIITSFDVDKLTCAIANVILNSCLFTRKDNEINVFLKKVNDNAIITITDKGRGMSSYELTRIFSSNYSKENNDNKYNSLGLGMPLVKEIIKIHGGQIAVSSIINEGTSIAITIPIKQQDEICTLNASEKYFIGDKFSPLFVTLAEVCSKELLYMFFK